MKTTSKAAVRAAEKIRQYGRDIREAHPGKSKPDSVIISEIAAIIDTEIAPLIESMKTSLAEHEEVSSILNVRIRTGEPLRVWKSKTDTEISSIQKALESAQ